MLNNADFILKRRFLRQPSVSNGAQQPVHAAAMRGDLSALAWLKDHGADMQAVAQETGQQPTHFAAAGRSLDGLAWLGGNGGDLTAVSGSGQQPLHLAALAGAFWLCQCASWLCQCASAAAAIPLTFLHLND